jgi:ribonuclease P protein component
MIAKKFRFHGHSSIKFVFSRGHAARSRYFSIKWTTNPRRQTPRATVIVSKKIFKSAVKRNRIRRRVYEIVRPFLKTQQNVDVAISVYSPDVLVASPEELRTQLESLLNQAFRYTASSYGNKNQSQQAKVIKNFNSERYFQKNKHTNG